MNVYKIHSSTTIAEQEHLGSSNSRKQKAGGRGGVLRSMERILPYCTRKIAVTDWTSIARVGRGTTVQNSHLVKDVLDLPLPNVSRQVSNKTSASPSRHLGEVHRHLKVWPVSKAQPLAPKHRTPLCAPGSANTKTSRQREQFAGKFFHQSCSAEPSEPSSKESFHRRKSRPAGVTMIAGPRPLVAVVARRPPRRVQVRRRVKRLVYAAPPVRLAGSLAERAAYFQQPVQITRRSQ